MRQELLYRFFGCIFGRNRTYKLKKLKKILRYYRYGRDTAPLIHICKLAKIEQHAAKVLEAVGLGVGVKGGHFLGGGRAAGCELMGAPDLAFQSF